jgi:hypothetical protein
MLSDRQVVAQVIGVVDRFVIVSVSPRIREVGFNFGVAQLAKRALPKDRRRELFRNLGNLSFVLFSEPLVDPNKNFFRASLARADVV